MERYFTSILKSLLPALVLIATVSIASAQSFVTYEPTQPCTTDSVTLTWDSQIPPGTGLEVEWYIYDNSSPGGTALLRGPSVKYLFSASGIYDISYASWDSTSGFLDSGFVSIFIDSICADNQITGLVFNDANGNGTQDAGELGIANKQVNLQPGNYYTYTDANGDYDMLVRPGSYTVGIELPLYYGLTAPAAPGTYSINFPTSGGSSTGNDFGIEVTQNAQDLRVSVNGWAVRPGFGTGYWISYQNIGTTTETATLTFTHDALLTYDQSTPAEDSYTGTTATYNLGALAPGDAGSIYVQVTGALPPTMDLGDVVSTLVSINPTTGDLVPDDNTDTLLQTVVGSFDPNDKAVLPSGADEAGTIFPTKTLRYQIRFQNTGTYLAEDVRVEDTLVSALDIVSFRTLDASHTYSYSTDPSTGAVVWYFNDIMLPDSNANEPMSHGFVTFEVDVIDWEQLPNGSEINNTAYIYFDFNEAIITNTTRTTFDRTVGIIEVAAVEASKLYPNPVSGTAVIEFASEGRNYNVRVMDLTGKVVLNTSPVSTDRIELDLTNLNGGMYLYEIVSEGTALSKGKFIVK